MVFTEYMTPEPVTLSKIISPGKDSKKATKKATKVNKKVKSNVKDKDVTTNKKDDKTVKNNNNTKKGIIKGKNLTNLETKGKTNSSNTMEVNDNKIKDTTKEIKGPKIKTSEVKGKNTTNVEKADKNTITTSTLENNGTKKDTTEAIKENKKPEPTQKQVKKMVKK